MNRRLVLTLFLVLVVTGGALLGPNAQETTKESTQRAKIVKTIAPEKKDHKDLVRYPGTALPFQEARLAAMVPGLLAAVNVFEGDVVDNTSNLAVIAVPDLRAEQAKAAASVVTAVSQLTRSKSSVEIAQATLKENTAAVEVSQAEYSLKAAVAERRKKLAKTRAVTTEQAQIAEAEAAVAKARSESALAGIEQAKANVSYAEASVQVAEAMLASAKSEKSRLDVLVGFALIRSPYRTAVATRRHLDAGAMVKVDGSPIVTVMDVSRIRVLVHVPERDVLRVKPGQSVELQLFADPKNAIRSEVTRISGALDPRTRTMRAEVEIPNTDRKILPGMLCDVHLTLAERKGALFLPASAVYGVDKEPYVLVVDGGVARRVEIQVGFEDGTEFEIVQGVSPGAVVIDGRPEIEDGDPVQSKPELGGGR